ncbi:MAG: TonB-dependent receptor [Caulobacteraceae bacterium]
MKKTVLLMSCALGALALSAGGAFAATAAAAAATTENSASTVSEIIVTAERREQNIQKVPVAVTAFTSQARNLKGINTVQDMTDFTPGFTYSSQLDRPAMRGLSRNNNIYLTDSSVAVYYDDFFSNSTFLVGRDDMLISDVQILLGPQGTLYGRNAIGGLINTLSKRPTPDWSGEVRGIVGNYGYTKIEGTVSGPIADNLAFRLSFYDENQTRGWLNNLVPGVPGAGGIRHDPYVDAQLEYKTDKDDLWLDTYGLTFNNDRGGPGSLLGVPMAGPYDASLSSLSWLVFNPDFAYGPPGTFSAPNAFGYAAPLGPVPGSVTGMVVPSNPAIKNIRDFANSLPVDINVRAAYAVVVHYTHHFDGFDMKYVGGYSQYRYNLFTNVFENDNSPITSYQIPLDPGGLCAAVQPLGLCSPLTVNPVSRFQYETETKWNSQELTFESTTNHPVQWIGGIYFYNESDNNPETWYQPNQPQIAAPASLATIGNYFGDLLGGNIPGILNGSFISPAIPNPSHDYLFLDYQDQINSLAGYAQVDWKVTPTIKFTGGVRYTFDWKKGMEESRYIDFTDTVLSGTNPGLVPFFNPSYLGSLYPALDITTSLIAPYPGLAKGVTCAESFPTTGPYAGDATRCLGDHSSAFTGTAGVEWTPDPDTLVYLRYNRGYKAFGYNAGLINSNPEAKPEFVDDIEGGVKKTFGRNLVIDADAFYYNYDNDQVPIGVPIAGVTVTEFINIPKSVSDGFELTANWSPIENLNLSLTYGLDHTSIRTGCSYNATTGLFSGLCITDAIDPGAIAPGARPVGPSQGFTGADTNAGQIQIANHVQAVNGAELPQAPENKVAFNATYRIPVTDRDNLVLSGTFVWKDKSYDTPFQRYYYEGPSWDQVNLRITWSGDNDRYEIVGYVDNLLNTIGYDAAAGGYGVTAPQGGGAYTWNNSYDLTPPRTYGMEIHYKF